MASSLYVGRFAPTPSGPLHFGSIIAALGSFLDARSNAGKWLVRIDDLDTPRTRPGAGDAILSSLELLGLHWDGEIQYQNTRHDAYQAGLDILRAKQLIYPCACPRKLVKGRPYPGTCRERNLNAEAGHALRLITGDSVIRLEDRMQGMVVRDLKQITGDFIIRRSDSLFAYHLATVIDDDWQKVTDVVRGGDLMNATICQAYLQSCLDLPRPRYCHLPVAVDHAGRKISKSNLEQDVLHGYPPAGLIRDALCFLGHSPDPGLADGPVEEIIQWGIDHWQVEKIPKDREIRVAECEV